MGHIAQKRLGLLLDSKVDFNKHIDDNINQCNKIIGIMTMTPSRKSFLIVWKSFVRPLSDYADIIHNIPCNDSFKRENLKQFSVMHV